MEVWEKYQVSSAFLANNHGAFSCVSCHGGRSGNNTKDDAHEGMLADPSDGESPACRSCHSETVAKHAASLHGTQNGYSTFFARRGASPQSQVEAMFDARCSGCHASCGQCHISRPASVEGGLVDGHLFLGTPSQTANCTACHGSRISDEFTGKNRFNDAALAADVHYLKMMNCMSCHSGHEMHGDGTTPATRYDVAGAPSCTDCHPEVQSDSNAWHGIHGRTNSPVKVQCQVCHSQPYKNCYSCHVELDKQGIRFPSQIDFRIAKNPLLSVDRPWEYVVVRHIPIAPDTYDPWGISLSDYTAEETWRFATPHNIRKRTTQSYPEGYPDVAGCADNCHDNPALYLTDEYIQSKIGEGVMVSEEIQANQTILIALDD